jgi:hypothetical protein
LSSWSRLGLGVSALWLGWSAACTCAPLACPRWITVAVRAPAWTPGVWTLRVSGDGTTLDCAWTIPASGAAPLLGDVGCDGRSDRTAFVLDTGGAVDPGLIELKVQVAGEVRPEAATVALAWSGTSGTWSNSASQPLSWAPIPTPGGTCWVNCETAHLDVAVPGVVP